MTPVERTNYSYKTLWRYAAAVFAVCTLIGLSFGGRTYFYLSRQGEEVILAQITASYLIDFYLWGLASPLILLLCRRFTVARGHLVGRTLLHLAASVVFSFGIIALSAPFYWWFGLADPVRLPTFWAVFVKSVSSPIGIHENALIYVMTALAAHAFIYYREARRRETESALLAAQSAQLSEQLVQAQLSALKMQLHPHFLFNTLNSIAALLHKDTETAHRMIARLSDFLRMTLKNSDTQSVRLDAELEFLNTYLEIEKIRFHDRLHIEMRIEPDVCRAQVPNLILQPLVENAVRHGLANVAGDGFLKISAARVGGRLRIEIEDNGPGLIAAASRRQRRIAANGGGVGIANTRARLAQFYGSAYKFEIHDKMDASGTVAALEVPFRTAEIED